MSTEHAATRRVEARGRIWASCGVALLAVAFSAIVSVTPLLSGGRSAQEVQRAGRALEQVSSLRTALTNFQVFAEPRMAMPTVSSPVDVARASDLAQGATRQAKVVIKTLPPLGLTGMAKSLATATTAYATATQNLAPVALGLPTAEVAAVVAAERAAFTQMWDLTATTASRLRHVRDVALQQTISHLDNDRRTVLAVDAFAAIIIVSAGLVFGRRARRREREERANAVRQDFETSLQEALEMAKTEPDVFRIAGRALEGLGPRFEVEMLVADSSRAHFHQAVNTAGPDARNGCAVVSPQDCPATSRGHTLAFPTSGALNACPYLQDNEYGACSATCVPVSIAGKTVGVTHATGPDHEPPTGADIRYLEITSRRASERIAMLRAFAKSETQASSDPLTGLWNRRSLENRVRDLQRDGIPYALAYGDLDQFKMLNDTHGHEAGDQALRLFSRVMRDSIRPDDIAARYGGEEFVIVMPDCNTTTATSVLERVRENLAIALTTGRVTAFTVSFGLASSDDASTFDEVVAIADHALLGAKVAGRNRVIVADATIPDATGIDRPAIPAA